MFFGNPVLSQQVQAFNKDVLLKALTDIGAQKISIEYSGGGDSGDATETSISPDHLNKKLNEITVRQQYVHGEYLEERWHYEVREKQVVLGVAISDFALHWIDLHHSGWENNDGGSGSVVMDVTSGEFRLEHTEYYTERNEYAYSL
jgi:hypothetical protein